MTQFTKGQRVVIKPYANQTFGTLEVHLDSAVNGTVTGVSEARCEGDGYGVAVLVDDEFMDRKYDKPFEDEDLAPQFDYTFTGDGRYISNEAVALFPAE